MRFRRRRRAGPKWTYASNLSLDVQTTSLLQGGLRLAWTWLLPPARVQYMLNTKGRDSMQFAGSHLWLDFHWFMQSTNSFPDVYFGAYKTTIADPAGLTPDLTPMVTQWDEPNAPATIASWDEDDDDGTNPFIWQHWIKGVSPVNSMVVTQTQNAQNAGNQYINSPNSDIDHAAIVCRKEYVTQEWQPDVILKSRRRLVKGEGILFCMAADDSAISNGVQCILNMRFRTLTK